MTIFEVGNQFRTKLYTKPSDKQNYLHNKSGHPRFMKNSITYSQAFCLNKICYNRGDLEINSAKSN